MNSLNFAIHFIRHIGLTSVFSLIVAVVVAAILVPAAVTHPTHAGDLSVMLLGGFIVGFALMGVMFGIACANFNALQRQYDDLKAGRDHCD